MGVGVVVVVVVVVVVLVVVGVVLGVVVVLGAIGVGVVGGVVVVGALTSRTHLQSSSARVKRGATHRIVIKVQMTDFTTVCRACSVDQGSSRLCTHRCV